MQPEELRGPEHEHAIVNVAMTKTKYIFFIDMVLKTKYKY